jgi:hypothetical protein
MACRHHVLEAELVRGSVNSTTSPEHYKEFLELAKLIHRESIDMKKGYVFQIQRPGADHHARWMAKSIYILHYEDGFS